MLVFPQQFLYSMGVGGLIAAITAAAIAVTVLPAIFLLLGPRIERFTVRRAPADESGQTSGWQRLALAAMRRPATVAVSTALVLVLLGLPFPATPFTPAAPPVPPDSA